MKEFLSTPLLWISLLGAAAFTPVQAETAFAGWAAGAPRNGYATILYTTNSGAEWVRQGGSDEIDNMLNCIAAADARAAWAVGLSGYGYQSLTISLYDLPLYK